MMFEELSLIRGRGRDSRVDAGLLIPVSGFGMQDSDPNAWLKTPAL